MARKKQNKNNDAGTVSAGPEYKVFSKVPSLEALLSEYILENEDYNEELLSPRMINFIRRKVQRTPAFNLLTLILGRVGFDTQLTVDFEYDKLAIVLTCHKQESDDEAEEKTFASTLIGPSKDYSEGYYTESWDIRICDIIEMIEVWLAREAVFSLGLAKYFDRESRKDNRNR